MFRLSPPNGSEGPTTNKGGGGKRSGRREGTPSEPQQAEKKKARTCLKKSKEEISAGGREHHGLGGRSPLLQLQRCLGEETNIWSGECRERNNGTTALENRATGTRRAPGFGQRRRCGRNQEVRENALTLQGFAHKGSPNHLDQKKREKIGNQGEKKKPGGNVRCEKNVALVEWGS